LVVGRGALVSGAQAELRALAERLPAPVIVSMDGKSVLTEDHPLYVGPVGSYCAPCANKVLAEADLVFFVGCSTGDQVTRNWTLPRAPRWSADINPAELGRNCRTLGILPTRARSWARVAGPAGRTGRRSAWAERARAIVAEWRASVQAQCSSQDVPIRPERLCADITAELPADAVVVADTGYSAIWAGTLIEILKPGQLFLRAAGSLGWPSRALGAMRGGRAAGGVLHGDGPSGTTCASETAVRWNIPTVTVINNNSVLGQSQLGIRRAYRGEKGREQQQYKFNDTNFARLAEDLGALGIRVEDPGQIRGALRRALDSGRPAVVDVVTEAESHPCL
jgi:acetolactate synthase-1/2/3 large subunit